MRVLAILVICAVLLAVIVGMRKKRPWALRFSRELGRPVVRVRGYLLPISRNGAITPRASIGLENSGLPRVRIGTGTPLMSYARHTVIEFEGTTDGSPPDVVVERGEVRIDRERVTRWHLKGGEIIEAEGLKFRYVRGHRR
jgi:hypothetical protein